MYNFLKYFLVVYLISTVQLKAEEEERLAAGSCFETGKIDHADYKGYFTKSLNDKKLDLKNNVILMSEIDEVTLKCYDGEGTFEPFEEIQKKVILDLSVHLRFLKGISYKKYSDQLPKDIILKIVILSPKEEVLKRFSIPFKIPKFKSNDKAQEIYVKDAVKKLKTISLPSSISLKDYKMNVFFELSKEEYKMNEKLDKLKYNYLDVQKKGIDL